MHAQKYDMRETARNEANARTKILVLLSYKLNIIIIIIIIAEYLFNI
jgi:hypothetical protein